MLLKKRKKLLSLLAALVMTLSISSVALAAGFDTVEGDGVFREYTIQSDPSLPPLPTTNRYEATVEATVAQENMLLNLDIDNMSGNNLISIANADLTLEPEVTIPFDLDLGEYTIVKNPTDPKATMIYAKVETIVYTEGALNPTQQEIIVLLVNNTNAWTSLNVKDVIGIIFGNTFDPASALVLIGGKSTIQLSNQNAQGGQNQQ